MDEIFDVGMSEIAVGIPQESSDVSISEESVMQNKVSETVETFNVKAPDDIIIKTNEAFAPMGEPNENLRHTLLTDRDLHDQHPILAITGLRKELDDIESLKTVYSDSINYANYYMWYDENFLKEDREGFFVSLRSNDFKIDICGDTDEIFGVCVNSAGFIGGQSEEMSRDHRYGLISHNGVVSVLCELDVNVGDYVVSNSDGVAKKTNTGYGYYVIDLAEINGAKYAIISLDISANQLCDMADIASKLDNRMNRAESNIASTMRTANMAYNKVSNLDSETLKKINELGIKVQNTIDGTNNIINITESLSDRVNEIENKVDRDISIVGNLNNEAVTKANEAAANVNQLILDLQPIYEWTNPDNPDEKGAEYLTKYLKDDVMTTTEIMTANMETQERLSSLEKSANGFEALVSEIDKYAIGEYSQAFGLMPSQAKSMLKKDMIYIPISDHVEIYVEKLDEPWNLSNKNIDYIYYDKNTKRYYYYDESWKYTETLADSNLNDKKRNFTKGYYYVWDGEKWIENYNNVYFNGQSYVVPGTNREYWYVDSDNDIEHNGDIYESKSLYMSVNGEWQKVDVINGSITNRVYSQFIQKADEIDLVVTDGAINSAEIIAAINNNGDSEVKLKGDKISLEGTIVQNTDGIETLRIDNGNITMQGKLVSVYSKRFYKKDYTEADLDIILDFIMTNKEKDKELELLDKYDFDGTGKLRTVDRVILSNLLSGRYGEYIELVTKVYIGDSGSTLCVTTQRFYENGTDPNVINIVFLMKQGVIYKSGKIYADIAGTIYDIQDVNDDPGRPGFHYLQENQFNCLGIDVKYREFNESNNATDREDSHLNPSYLLLETNIVSDQTRKSSNTSRVYVKDNIRTEIESITDISSAYQNLYRYASSSPYNVAYYQNSIASGSYASNTVGRYVYDANDNQYDKTKAELSSDWNTASLVLTSNNSAGTKNIGTVIVKASDDKSSETDKAYLYVDAGGSTAVIAPTHISCKGWSSSSLESIKKNIDPLNDAMGIVKQGDIYSYNFKSEDDDHKKHYGLVISDETGTYNAPDEVMADDYEGIDMYCMTSVLWQAVKELSAEVDSLKEEIKELKNK